MYVGHTVVDSHIKKNSNLISIVGADGPGGARDPHPEQSDVQQPPEELQTGGGEA